MSSALLDQSQETLRKLLTILAKNSKKHSATILKLKVIEFLLDFAFKLSKNSDHEDA
jgi:hypothetical protein